MSSYVKESRSGCTMHKADKMSSEELKLRITMSDTMSDICPEILGCTAQCKDKKSSAEVKAAGSTMSDTMSTSLT
ncbi:hypothetical protein GmHk_09G025761 [Glycine max]|nr:hypothetical protein GmHk_09G025761 [Glycine max]